MLPTARKLAFTDVPVIDLGAGLVGRCRQAARVGGRDRRGLRPRRLHVHQEPWHRAGRHRRDLPDRRRFSQPAARRQDGRLDVAQSRCAGPGLSARHDQGHRQEHSRRTCRRRSRFRRPLADDDPDLLAGKPLHGRIPWPSAMPDLKPRMMAYYDKVDGSATRC